MPPWSYSLLISLCGLFSPPPPRPRFWRDQAFSSLNPACLTSSSPLLGLYSDSLSMRPCPLLLCVPASLCAPLWQITEVTVYSHLSVNHRQLRGSTERSYFSILHPFFLLLHSIAVTRTMTKTTTKTMTNTYGVLIQCTYVGCVFFLFSFRLLCFLPFLWQMCEDWQDKIIFCQCDKLFATQLGIDYYGAA